MRLLLIPCLALLAAVAASPAPAANGPVQCNVYIQRLGGDFSTIEKASALPVKFEVSWEVVELDGDMEIPLRRFRPIEIEVTRPNFEFTLPVNMPRLVNLDEEFPLGGAFIHSAEARPEDDWSRGWEPDEGVPRDERDIWLGIIEGVLLPPGRESKVTFQSQISPDVRSSLVVPSARILRGRLSALSFAAPQETSPNYAEALGEVAAAIRASVGRDRTVTTAAEEQVVAGEKPSNFISRVSPLWTPKDLEIEFAEIDSRTLARLHHNTEAVPAAVENFRVMASNLQDQLGDVVQADALIRVWFGANTDDLGRDIRVFVIETYNPVSKTTTSVGIIAKEKP